MITKLSLNIAKQYANTPDPTIFEKKQLVKLFIMTDDNYSAVPSETYRAVSEMYDKHPDAFNRFLEKSINHFK